MQIKQKTYAHLLSQARIPTEYDIVSSQLLYYSRSGFSVDVPQKAWYEKYQKGALLTCQDWEQFRDPRATTYAKYTTLQHNKEIFATRIFHAIENQQVDPLMDPAWRQILNDVLPPMRYAAHAFQMIASYIGQMAPTGRITIVFAMQAADHLRMIECIAYRMAQLRRHSPTFGDDSNMLWHTHPAWQPLRKALEILLTTYDWTEAFYACNRCLKPLLDTLFCVNFATYASSQGDTHLASLLGSLHEDTLWHHAFSESLSQLLTADPAASTNQNAMAHWATQWDPLAHDAMHALATLWQEKRN